MWGDNFFEVHKHVQIRMDAYHKYIDSLLDKACKIAHDQISSASLNNPFMCSYSVQLSTSTFHQISDDDKSFLSSIGDGQFFYQRSPQLKRKPT